MHSYSCIQQNVQLIKLFYKNEGYVRATHRTHRIFYGRHNRPSIRREVDTLETPGLVNDQPTLLSR